MAQGTRTTYEELETVAISKDVPELSVEAGTTGTIVTVYEGGRMLLVEVGREDGTSVGLVDLKVGDHDKFHAARGRRRRRLWHVMTYTPFD